MKAFYLIHATIILEVIIAILVVLKMHELIFKLQKLNLKITEKATKKAQEISHYRTCIEVFNQKFEQKMNYIHNFDLVKNLLLELSIQGLLKKFIFPKKSFLAKIMSYKTTIFWFLASFFFFKNRNA